jgi:hypothetical protein
MTTAAGNRTVNLLTGAILLCLAGLVYLFIELRSTQEVLRKSLEISEQLAEDAAAIEAVVNDQQIRIDSIEMARGLAFRVPDVPTTAALQKLQPGIYVLETQTPYDPKAEESVSYDITHVIVDIRYEEYGTRLHIGVAKSGWVPAGVYFDYNNDGRVDTDMALEFVRDIPIIGRRLAEAYGPELAQNLYSIFVKEAANAAYTSVEDLNEDAEAASNYVWSFLSDYYGAIETWVLKKIRDEQVAEGDQ